MVCLSYIWSVFIVNVGKCTSVTDPIGNTNVFKSHLKDTWLMEELHELR